MTSAAESAPAPKSILGHPQGLFVLFTAEMWERFNFYGMRALLTLFLANALAFSEKDASIIYGGFLGLSYLTPMLGGFIADRFLGNRLCILLGGSLMSLGQLLLFLSGILYTGSVETATFVMWAALGALIFGNGFFKPNISSMVGQLYPKGDNRLDSAFTIFYMGINLGAMLGIIICPILGDVKVGDVRVTEAFKWGFLAAAIAMALGTITFYFLKNKYLTAPDGSGVGERPKHTATADGQASKAEFSQQSIIGALVGLVAMIFAFKYVVNLNWVYAFIYSSGLTLAGLILTDKSITRTERDRIIVLYFVAFFVMFFWACFEQAGSSLTFVADAQTDRRVFGFDLPPSLIQFANSFFIIALALPFSYMWLSMGKNKIEPSSPTKQGIGLIILSLGFLVMAWQTKDLGTTGKLGVVWLFVMYLLHTIGELCLSPIGLSLVSKLAPLRFTSLLMGVWFLANAAGYALAGTLGALIPPTGDKFKIAQEAGVDLPGVLSGSVPLTPELSARFTELRLPTEYPSIVGIQITNLYEFFMVFFLLPASAGVLMLLVAPRLRKMMHGVN
jgi:POT family proton-dependent oligopeptide transporter